MMALFAVGYYIDFSGDKSLISLHKAVGSVILMFAIARILWRVAEGWPSSLPTHNSLEKLLSRVVKWVLISGSLLMPLSGVLGSIAGGRGWSLLGLTIVPSNGTGRDAVALSSEAAQFLGGMHSVVAYIVVAALALHIVGAFKHHIIDKDDTLKRMGV